MACRVAPVLDRLLNAILLLLIVAVAPFPTFGAEPLTPEVEADYTLSNEAFDDALVPVRARDPALADGLADLARDFRFDRILTLIGEQADEGS